MSLGDEFSHSALPLSSTPTEITLSKYTDAASGDVNVRRLASDRAAAGATVNRQVVVILLLCIGLVLAMAALFGVMVGAARVASDSYLFDGEILKGKGTHLTLAVRTAVAYVPGPLPLSSSAMQLLIPQIKMVKLRLQPDLVAFMSVLNGHVGTLTNPGGVATDDEMQRNMELLYPNVSLTPVTEAAREVLQLYGGGASLWLDQGGMSMVYRDPDGQVYIIDRFKGVEGYYVDGALDPSPIPRLTVALSGDSGYFPCYSSYNGQAGCNILGGISSWLVYTDVYGRAQNSFIKGQKYRIITRIEKYLGYDIGLLSGFSIQMSPSTKFYRTSRPVVRSSHGQTIDWNDVQVEEVLQNTTSGAVISWHKFAKPIYLYISMAPFSIEAEIEIGVIDTGLMQIMVTPLGSDSSVQYVSNVVSIM